MRRLETKVRRMSRTDRMTGCPAPDLGHEEGSLIVALVVILVLLVLFGAMVTAVSVAFGFSGRVHTYNSSLQEANAAISDAAFQLDQYIGTDMNALPASFCVSSLSPTPAGCTPDTFAASNNGANGWTYQAQLLPPPRPGMVMYKVTADGYFNGAHHRSIVYFYRFVSHDGLTGLWGLNANGSLCIYPTDSMGNYVDTDNDATTPVSTPSCKTSSGPFLGDGDNDSDDWSSAGVNQGAVSCTGLVTGQGFVNIYGRSTAGTTNCNGTPTGSAPLNPQNPFPSCPPPVNTIPPTPCVPPNTGANYYTGGSGSYGPNCPPNGVFSGAIQPLVYICYGPITLNPPITVASGSTNNGQAQIFVFMPPGTPVGSTVVTFNSGGGINAGGPSTNLQIYVSDPNTCGPPSNGTVPGGGNVIFNGNGSNIPGPIDATLYAPNDKINVINGAPFTSWVGNILVCYMRINGGGNAKATIYDDVFYNTVYSPWYTAGYTD
jgi:hypothetical protein